MAASSRRSLTVESATTRVSQAARKHYDKTLGRQDWEAVAKDLGLPLLECLHRYDPGQSGIAKCSRPKITDWTTADLDILKSFVTQHLPAAPSNRDWRLAGVFMNTNYVDCFRAYDHFQHRRMTEDLFTAISRDRAEGLTWDQIHRKWPFLASSSSLIAVYRSYADRQAKGVIEPATGKNIWTRAETERIQKIIDEYKKHGGGTESLADLVMAAFPGQTREVVQQKIRNMKQKPVTYSTMDQVKKLVDQHGHQWEIVGRQMDMTPRQAQRAWQKYLEHGNSTKIWSRSELDILHNCIRDGLGPAESSRLIGTKGTRVCSYMMRKLQRKPDQMLPPQKWTEQETARLLHIVQLHKDRCTWAEIASQFGRSVGSCKSRYHVCKDSLNK